MFEYLANYSIYNEINVLKSFSIDMDKATKNKEDNKVIFKSYLKKFPEYRGLIKQEYDNLSIIPVVKQKHEIIIPKKIDLISEKIMIQEMIRELTEYLHIIELLEHPYGKMILEIENRIKYLNKHYVSQSLGLDIPIKDW
jgi:hypothetical protein